MKITKKSILAFMKRRDFIVLMLIFLLGLILRSINLWDEIIFAYDQGRDAHRIYDMVFNYDFKIVGPETDIPGVFNGPLYYYILAPLYFISRFDPNIVAIFFILINLSAIIPLYYFGSKIFHNKHVGYIAAFLWSISYAQGNFARYISNASFMSISITLFFLGIALYIFKKKSYGLTLSVVALGFAIHFNIYLAYLGLLYIIYYFLYKPSITLKRIIINFSLLILIVFNFILTEFIWNFMSTRSFINYFSGQSDNSLNILNNISRYLDKLAELIYYSYLSVPTLWALIVLGSILLVVIRKEKYKKELAFVLIWLFSTLPLFNFESGVITVPVINTSIFGAAALIIGLGIYHMYKSPLLRPVSILLFGAMIVSNVLLFVADEFVATSMLVGNPLLLRHERAALDYTHKSSGGEQFSICAVTNPLFINTTWSYLYTTYSNKTESQIPYWSGQPQFLNKSNLDYDRLKIETKYLIIEPLIGIPEIAKQSTIFMEDHVSDIVEEVKYDDLIVQKRRLNPSKEFNDTQNLSVEEIEKIQEYISIDPRYSCFTNYE